MVIDVHLHSRFSFDSEENEENYIAEALKKGVPAVGFSEHYDYDAFLDGADIALADLPEYTSCVEKLKRAYNKPQILCGVEFGYCAAALEHYKELCVKYNFDYIINSVHTVPGRGDSYFPAFFIGRTTREAYLDYFKAVLESVKSNFDYQIVGHIGYVSRYCKGENSKIKYVEYSEILDEILKEIIRRDKCLEINTSSANSGSDFLPDKDIIERYITLGGEKLSFASDAHSACDYLRKADVVSKYLKSIGVERLYYYKNRKAVAYNI